MTTNTNNIPEGVFYGNGTRQAMIVLRDGVARLEIYQIEDMPNGQWYRNSKVSMPLSETRYSEDVTEVFPEFEEEEIPNDFWLPQGEITVQMYGEFAPAFSHMALVVTRRANFWKARGFARNIGAWYVLENEKGLLAQFPGQNEPWFFSWEQFKTAMDNHFPVK